MNAGNDIVMDLIRDILREKSQKAITSGNKLTGFMGEHLEAFSKEELIQMLHILNDDHYRTIDRYTQALAFKPI